MTSPFARNTVKGGLHSVNKISIHYLPSRFCRSQTDFHLQQRLFNNEINIQNNCRTQWSWSVPVHVSYATQSIKTQLISPISQQKCLSVSQACESQDFNSFAVLWITWLKHSDKQHQHLTEQCVMADFLKEQSCCFCLVFVLCGVFFKAPHPLLMSQSPYFSNPHWFLQLPSSLTERILPLFSQTSLIFL